MIEHYFIALIYIGGFMGLAAIAEGIFKLCDYISDRRIMDKPIEDKLRGFIGLPKTLAFLGRGANLKRHRFSDKSENEASGRICDDVRQIKIKPLPDYISMIKNEYADEAEPISKSQRIKIGI